MFVFTSISVIFARYLKDKKISDAPRVFREAMLAVSHARELRYIRDNARRKIRL